MPRCIVRRAAADGSVGPGVRIVCAGGAALPLGAGVGIVAMIARAVSRRPPVGVIVARIHVASRIAVMARVGIAVTAVVRLIIAA